MVSRGLLGYWFEIVNWGKYVPNQLEHLSFYGLNQELWRINFPVGVRQLDFENCHCEMPSVVGPNSRTSPFQNSSLLEAAVLKVNFSNDKPKDCTWTITDYILLLYSTIARADTRLCLTEEKNIKISATNAHLT
jgi:hypothetical protein